MIALLSEKRDKALTQRWGLWLTKRDPESGLKASYITYLPFHWKSIWRKLLASYVSRYREKERKTGRRHCFVRTDSRCESNCCNSISGISGSTTTKYRMFFVLLLIFRTHIHAITVFFIVKGLAYAISKVMRGPSFILPSRRHRIQTLASKRCI